MSIKYFYDLPVYRLPADEYYLKREEFLSNTPGSLNATFKQHLINSYGGCWEFNEIVGYIRLHFLGTQVRGEYFGINKQRIRKTRTKIFENLTLKLAPEIEIQYPISTANILIAVRQYISDCKKILPGRFVDDQVFEMLANNINWENFLK